MNDEDLGMCTALGGSQPATRVITTEERDPVCGMRVDPTTAPYTDVHAGTSYYFCSRGCLEKFHAHPEQYVSGTLSAGPLTADTTTTAAAVYTCPMHPDVARSYRFGESYCGYQRRVPMFRPHPGQWRAPEDIARSVQDSLDSNLQDPRTDMAKERVHAATAVRAYELYLGRGGEHGHDLDDWLRAESEIQQCGPSES